VEFPLNFIDLLRMTREVIDHELTVEKEAGRRSIKGVITIKPMRGPKLKRWLIAAFRHQWEGLTAGERHQKLINLSAVVRTGKDRKPIDVDAERPTKTFEAMEREALKFSRQLERALAS